MSALDGLPTSVASTATGPGVQLLAINRGRKGATVYNDSSAILYLILSQSPPTTSSYTVQIAAGGYYEVPYGYFGIVGGIWASANGNARITELV